jgi:hypothetical protein
MGLKLEQIRRPNERELQYLAESVGYNPRVLRCDEVWIEQAGAETVQTGKLPLSKFLFNLFLYADH